MIAGQGLDFPIYIRVRQVDYDGTSTISPVRVVQGNSSLRENVSFLEISPNPSTKGGFMHVKVGALEQDFVIKVFTVTGKLLAVYYFSEEDSTSSVKQMSIPSPELSGCYVLKVVLPDKILSKKFVTQ